MYVIVGNADDKTDPHRWLWDGMHLRPLADEQDYAEVSVLFRLHPNFNTLASPFWKPKAWIEAAA